jgi:hypothetical protein
METLIGFAVGFLVGSHYGRDGVAKVMQSWEAISTSPEVRKLVRTGMSVAGSAVREVMSGGAGAMLGGVAGMVTRKANEMAGNEHGA